MAPRVLISDNLSPAAVEVFTERGIEVDFQPELGKDKDRLAAAIKDFDGLAVRSASKVTEKVLRGADRLKVVGRAGIGVDNIDVEMASAKGVIVMNTPFGNSITTAEHTISLMLALARQIPEADASTKAGKWEKSRFVGVEITGKTLGVIGCGNIGSIVAERARGLRMRVVAHDPYLSAERAETLGVERVDLEELYSRADIITLHTPLTDRTRNVIDAAAIAKMRKGVRIINCARGGLVVEAALKEALESGHVAGAALDVFETEPPADSPILKAPNLVCTPHLGASTHEAQEKVALQVAEQMSEYLLTGAIANAVNFPAITAEEAPKLGPFVNLAQQLGSFAGQLTETAILGLRIEYVGEVGELNTRALTAALLTGALKPQLQDVNMVSAPHIARERGIDVEEVRRERHGIYGTYMRLTVRTERQERSVAGTVFSDGKPRLIQVKGIDMEAQFGPHMLYVTHTDRPGLIGALGSTLGEAQVNIATFNLGRQSPGGDAIALLEVDEPITDEVLAQVAALPNTVQAKRLAF